MKKNIYNMLNEVKVDLNKYKREEFTDIEKTKLKKNFKKVIKNNNTIYKKGVMIASVAVLSIGLFGTNLGGNVLAYANTVASGISSYLGIEKNLDEYKTVINKPVTKNGITIKLNEVVLDDNELVVSTTLTSNEKIGEGFITSFGKVYVNGKDISDGEGGSAKKIDEYTGEELATYNLEGDLKGALNIKLVFSDVKINGKTKKGLWEFEFKTNGHELAVDTKTILLNKTFTLENGQNITLKKYASNNLGQKVYYSKDSKGTRYDIVLRGYDDLENKIEFCLSSEKDGNGILKLNTVKENLNSNAKMLTLTPYAVKFPDKSGKMSNDFKKVGKEFKIDLTK